MTTNETPAACDGTAGHLLHIPCAPCTAEALKLRSLADVDNWFEQGVIGSDARDGYRHVWALSAVRSKAYDHWKSLPVGEFARNVASELTKRIPNASYHR